MTAPTLYKWLRPDHRGAYSHGDYSDFLPHGQRAGEWLPSVTPELCRSGYHVVRARDLTKHWCVPGELYVVEVRGAHDGAGDNDKEAHEQVRLVSHVGTLTSGLAVTFAADCAERVLEHVWPKDRAVCEAAIEAARAWVLTPNEKTHSAAANAANAAAAAANAYTNAANAAAANAAAAAYAAYAATAAANAYTNAAYAASAANAAAYTYATVTAYATDDAYAAEQTWQAKRLLALLT